MVGKYKVITLCGSTRYKDVFMEAQKRLTLEGNIVLSVGLYEPTSADEVWNEGIEEMLYDMHLRKIDMADEVFVINPGGYIGKKTQDEINYAMMNNKKISYLENDPVTAMLMQQIEEAEKQYQDIEEKRKKHVHVMKKEDMTKVNSETELVWIDSDENVSIPDFFVFREIRDFIVYPVTSWEKIGKTDFGWLERLKITVPEEQRPQRIDGFYLKTLEIIFQETLENSIQEPDKYKLDFSGCEDIEKLSLWGPINIDFTNIGDLHKLNYLKIFDAFREHLNLKLPPTLETLIISGKYWDINIDCKEENLQKICLFNTEISDLEWLTRFKHIEWIEISDGNMLDVSPLLSLPNLKHINIQRNPVRNLEMLREKKSIEVLYTDKERSLYNIKRSDFDFLMIIRQMHYSDEHYNEFNHYLQSEIQREREMGMVNRVKILLQKEFERRFEQFGNSAWEKEPEELIKEYRQNYVKVRLEKYPFLRITDQMKKLLAEV